MPAGAGDRGLPSAKTWKQWYEVRLRTWAAAVDAEFESEMDQYVKGLNSNITNQKANKMLAYEICSHQVDDRMLLYLLHVPKTDGAGMLRALYRNINKTTDERTAALHERFSRPTACKVKEKLSLALASWKEDLEELQAAGAAPSRETVVASLKLLVGQVRELKGLLDLLELMHPNDPKRMFGVAQRKATEWSVIDADPRTADVQRPTVNNTVKTTVRRFFAKGACRNGKACKYAHEQPKR